MLTSLLGVLFDGLAYGSLLFLISNGLSVTMGLMNFVNLAHGAFAMLGGYLCVALMRQGVPFLVTLPLVFVGVALVGAVLERTLYRRLYKAPHLDQVLFSIGLTFIAVAAATWAFGPSQQPVGGPPPTCPGSTSGATASSSWRSWCSSRSSSSTSSAAPASARRCAPPSTTPRRPPAWGST